MLSRKCDAQEFIKNVQQKSVLYVENKFDGERFQLHMKDGCFKYFSRNGFLIDNYGASYRDGSFTPLLKDVFHESVRSVILDGEMMGYNKIKKRFGSKGTLK